MYGVTTPSVPPTPQPPGTPHQPLDQPLVPQQPFPGGGGYTVPPQGYSYPYPQPGYGYPLAPAPVAPGGQRLAEFSDRLVARLIDGAILGGAASVVIIPLYLVAVLVLVSSVPTTTATGDPYVDPADLRPILLAMFGLVAVVVLLTLAMSYLYEVEMMFRTGQTLGKRLMKIQVIPVDPTLTLTRGIAAKRFLVTNACSMVPGLGWVDALWQLWDKPYRQCLHDKYPRTLVIKLNP